MKPHTVWLGALLVSVLMPLVRASNAPNKPHSRQKRLLWLTTDGRLALPPGTSMVITTSISLPFVRYPPEGFYSNISIALPFTSKFSILQEQVKKGTGEAKGSAFHENRSGEYFFIL